MVSKWCEMDFATIHSIISLVVATIQWSSPLTPPPNPGLSEKSRLLEVGGAVVEFHGLRPAAQTKRLTPIWDIKGKKKRREDMDKTHGKHWGNEENRKHPMKTNATDVVVHAFRTLHSTKSHVDSLLRTSKLSTSHLIWWLSIH